MLFRSIEGIVEYIGVTVDGVGTTPLAGAASFNRGLSPEMASIVQALAYGAYDDFIELVASGRDMTEQAVREVADGLVWTGAEAAELGLVDVLGGLDGAVAAAARLAGVEEWRIARTRVPPSFESVLLQELSRSFGMVAAPLGGWFESLVSAFKPAIKSLSSLRDPMHVYAQCLPCAPLL